MPWLCQTTANCPRSMPLPIEIDLLSTRVDSYRHPIDTPSTTFRHPKILVLTPAATAKTINGRPPIDRGRQLSTWVNRSKTEILKGPCRQFFTPIRHDLAYYLSNGMGLPWPPFGMGFGKNPIQTGGRFHLMINS